jgi:hypothetical protein
VDNGSQLMQAALTSIAGWTISYLADVATLVGLGVTIVGFVVTIINVLKSKSAAERAERAAQEARSNLLRVDSIALISSIIAGLEDVKRLHRSGSWQGMPERYGVQRRMLISVRAGNLTLRDAQKTTLQSAIQQLSAMEKQIEEHLANPGNAPDIANLNGIISKQADKLTQLLTELKING